MKKQQSVIVWVIISIIVIIGVLFLVKDKQACTEEALMCPDGSSVVREGPQCQFSACPTPEKISGTVVKSEGNYFLHSKSTLPDSGGIYVVPLSQADGVILDSVVGKEVTVDGEFTNGNTLVIDDIESIAVVPTPKEFVETYVANQVTRRNEDGDLEKTMTLQSGQKGKLLDFELELVSVDNDSRCPIDVQCITAGEVVVTQKLSIGNETKTMQYSSMQEPIQFGAFSIAITDISPKSKTSESTRLNSYSITYLVTATPQSSDEGAPSEEPSEPETIADCQSVGGELNEFNECLGISENQCTEIKGTYNECASACRNDPGAELCTLQCVQVCDLKAVQN